MCRFVLRYSQKDDRWQHPLFRDDRHRACHLANHIDKFGVAGNDDLRVVLEGVLDRFQSAQQLCVANEVLVGGFVDELYGKG